MKYIKTILFFIFFLIFVHDAYAAAETDVYLTPATKSVVQGNSFTSSVMINSGSNLVISGDIVIKFNPAVLSALTISTGDFLPTANVVQKKIDNTGGTVIYSFYTQSANAKAGTGSIIKIKWSGVGIGTDSVSFDASRTLIYASSQGSALRSTAGAVYTVKPGPTPTFTPIPTQNLVATNTPSPTPDICNTTVGIQSEIFSDETGESQNVEPKTSMASMGPIESTLVNIGACRAPMVNGTQSNNSFFPFFVGIIVGVTGTLLSMWTKKHYRSKIPPRSINN